MIFKQQPVFLKRSLDNVSLDWSEKITSSCDWPVIATLLSGKTEAGLQDCKNIFPRAQFTRQVFCSFLSAPMCGKSRKHSFNTEVSWIPLFHAHGRCRPSFWVTGTTHFESVDMNCQIRPIKGYTRSWYTGTGRLKKWLQALSPFLFLFFAPPFFRVSFTFAPGRSWVSLKCSKVMCRFGRHTKIAV